VEPWGDHPIVVAIVVITALVSMFLGLAPYFRGNQPGGGQPSSQATAVPGLIQAPSSIPPAPNSLGITSDDFNRADGSDPGSSWTAQLGGFDIRNNELNMKDFIPPTPLPIPEATPHADDDVIIWNQPLPGPDYVVEADVKLTAEKEIHVIARMQDNLNMYAAELSAYKRWVRLYKIVNGVAYPLPGGSEPPDKGYTLGQTYRLKLSVVGDLIRVYLNDSEEVSIRDSTFTTAGKAGLGTNAPGSSWDNFVVRSP
jgi:hypothetical protein